ncbi:MAG TPA: SDR family NAD(P)-dependent oxidoreductase [Nitrospirae bacterium]|nr:GDP-6-deoxy-D-mannose reductase [bacterium BMS3Abin10]GBE39911.1 GDP-6-deoxy-D-mannose reductase [bacterium BMS3Bbin08]HDK81411.1 SDR family NAD(P)-dependent oxidoreductase [Nitrospirota bacterium]HDO25986.1 SDR family NAD(P)-dependent oxidoreductase [Nitrospirota bacterium]
MELKNKKVLVTGADGFIGSHLVERLIEEGCKVKAFVFYNSFNSWGWLDTISPELLEKIEIFPGDIRDPNGVRTALKDVNVVFNLAALIAIPFSYHSPDAYIDTNIKGSINILQACKDYDIDRIIFTSTSEVYGTARYVPIDESHPLQGQSPYSATKIGADKIAESFHKSFGLPVVIARPFNTYGPRQSARAIIPTIITQLLSGEKEIKLGSLRPTRDFNYVKDICEGIVSLAKCEEAIGREINICSNKEISIGELAQMLINMIKPDAKVVSDEIRVRPEESEVERLMGENSLIRKLTGWQPDYTLKQGLEETIEWFKEVENLRRYKPNIYNI